MMNIRNAAYDRNGTITAEIEHPQLGWIPSTLSPDDAETAALFHEAKKGRVATYVAPPAPSIEVLRERASISRATFLVACVNARLLTESDALEAADGTWPSAFNAFFEGVPLEQRIAAKAMWADNWNVRRNNPILAQIAAHLKVPDAALDAMFEVE